MIHNKVDLNLYRVLVAVHQTQSVSKAAEQLHITQPAVSHALGKLREAFNDPLFERDGRSMKPTPKMLSMFPSIVSALEKLTQLPATQSEFEIAEQNRTIRLGARDILEAPLLPELAKKLMNEGPLLTLATQQLALKQMEASFLADEVDLVVDAWVPTHTKLFSDYMFDEQFSIVVRPDHPLVTDNSLKTYLASQHLVVSIKDSDLNLVDTALAKHQAKRNVQVYCEHYLSGLQTVSQSDLVMTMPKQFAVDMQETLNVTVLEPPVVLPSIPVFMVWHERTMNDPVLVWFRQHLKALLLKKYSVGML